MCLSPECGITQSSFARHEFCENFTPTALNSGAQRRAAHAGVPVAPMIEPQRGCTNNIQYGLGLIHCGTPLGFEIFYPIQPSVRCATLGFGVELRCSSFQFGLH